LSSHPALHFRVAPRAISTAVAFVGILAGIAACRRSPPAPRGTGQGQGATLDDFGDTVVQRAKPPTRIVSLNPATTAMLFAMGAGSRVVGRTRWDTYPPAVQAITDVGDGLRPNVEAVLAQRPDLVILYASADDRIAADAFHRAGLATLSLRIDRIGDFARALRMLGFVLHDEHGASVVSDSVLSTIARVHTATATLTPVTLVWIVDDAPLRVIGGGSYLNTLVTDAGGRNLYGDVTDPAPVVSLENVLHQDPSALVMSPSLARTIRADPRWQGWLRGRPSGVVVPDTALVGMPSVRMGEATTQLASLLHPGTGR
jgi:iron complex transport system substrate-binding protein